MLFKHSSIYILAKLIPGLVAFSALSLYTHLLTPEEYGIYTLIFSSGVFLYGVIFSWLPAGTLRFWANSKCSESVFVNTLSVTYARIILVLFVMTLIGVILFWNHPFSKWIVLTSFLLIALTLFAITQTIFSARIKPFNYALLTISYSLMSICFGGTLAYFGYGSTGVIIGITLGTLLPAIFVFHKIWLPIKKDEYDSGLFKKLLTYGMPLAAAAFVEEITKVSDRFMLAGFQGKAEAGYYAAGYDLSGNSILMIMSAINLAAYPVVIKLLDTKGKDVAMEYFREYVVLLLGISIPAVIGLNLVGADLIYLLIDEEFQPAVIYLLPWVSVAIFLLGLQVFYFDLSFQLGNKTISAVKIAIVISITNVILNYWLIPKIGIKGAAIATLSSFAIGTILSIIYGRKCFKLPVPWNELLKIIISSFVMGLSLWWLQDFRGWLWFLLQILVGSISYFIMILVFNILDIRTKVFGKLSIN